VDAEWLTYQKNHIEEVAVRLKVNTIGSGLHPREKVVEIVTIDGRARLAVDIDSVKNDSLDVGFSLNNKEDKSLVELPRETSQGFWRVWVPKSELIDTAA
jgi:hypothetical protein